MKEKSYLKNNPKGGARTQGARQLAGEITGSFPWRNILCFMSTEPFKKVRFLS